MVFKLLPQKPTLRSVPVKDDESHRVAAGYKDKKVTIPAPGILTLYDVAKYAFDTVRL